MNYQVRPEIVLYGVDKKEVVVPEIKVTYNSDKEIKDVKFSSSLDVADFLRKLYDENTIEVQESFFVLYLSRANKLKGYYRQSLGGVNGTVADLRLIFAPALKSLSSSIIVAHNHPSGNIQPSDADIVLTKKLREVGKTMDIPVMDHIIITTEDYYSFADEGRLSGLDSNINKSVTKEKKYTIANKEIERRVQRQEEERKHNMKTENSIPKKVKNLTEEIKFIRRFVGMHNKVKTPNAVLTFVKSLQKSITQRLIKKDSSFVKEIYYIQDTLISFYNRMKGEMKILLEEKTLSKLVAISGGEYVYPSVGFIKAFIGMQGKEITKEKRVAYLKRLANAANSKRILREDPFADKLNKIYSYLRNEYKDGQKVIFEKAELSGLACICNANKKEIGSIYDTKGKPVRRCRSNKYSDAKRGACSYNRGLASPYLELGKIFDTRGKSVRKCRSRKYSDADRGACSYNKGLAGIMTAEEVANMKFDLLPFSGDWATLIGKPEKNFSMMVHGEPGAGKTVFLLKFTKYLSSLGSVLYMTSEEFGSATLTDKVNKYLNPIPSNVSFVSRLGVANIKDYNFVIFDSITDLKISLDEFKAFKESYPNTAFILVMQNTKGGFFKGGKDWEHEVQIAGEVEEGNIHIYKNRYGNRGEMNFFDKK